MRNFASSYAEFCMRNLMKGWLQMASRWSVTTWHVLKDGKYLFSFLCKGGESSARKSLAEHLRHRGISGAGKEYTLERAAEGGMFA